MKVLPNLLRLFQKINLNRFDLLGLNRKINLSELFRFRLNLRNLFRFRLDLSFYSLILVNIAIMILGLVKGLDFATLLFIYWGQSIIIGLFNFTRILSLKNFTTQGFKVDATDVRPNSVNKNSTAVFFLFKYGILHLAYLAYLSWRFDVSFLYTSVLLLGVGLFFVNHLFSFIKNFKHDTEKRQTLGRVMFFPYLRTIPMHLIILFGLFLFGGRGIFFFLLLKTFVDVFMHEREHRDRSLN